LPEIAPVLKFEAAVKIAADVRLFLDEAPDAPPILRVLPVTRNSEQRVAVLLGPEGGWTDDERHRGITAGWSACSLGRNILRAETAAIAALSVIQAAWTE
jgi:16S rRNA (uracil1498-N3)-methyltransferase